MKTLKHTRKGVLILLLAVNPCAAASGRAAKVNTPRVIAPPARFFEMVNEKDRDAARAFYKKYLEVGQLPVAASAQVADEALQRASSIVTHMLAGRPDILDAMVKNRMYLIIIGKDQKYTDMPEYRNSRNPDFLNERVRGTGGRPTSFGEENLLSLPLDRYDDESIGVHEFCHTIDGTLSRMDPTWRSRKDATYQNAVAKGLFKDTYAGSNAGEYWAEICQSYFDNNRVNNWNHGPIRTREQMKLYDPEGYELVRTTFNLSPEQDWHYTWLRKLPNVTTPPAKFNIDPYYTKFTWAREFTVLGQSAGNEALLKVNDTIRKMFAYRHDILKALIADGVKLVVLGKNETISDLPEYKGRDVKGLDRLVRSVDYSPETKTLVVDETNLLRDLRDPLSSGCEVIRVMAKAMYYATGLREVDPNWESRPRGIWQQYELRVQRMDVRFDQKLKDLHEKAITAGKWKGTPGINDRADYWTWGVLAYFDATGAGMTPVGADHPITTREMLRDYDPDLFALVDETMAYKGRVDWRYQEAISLAQIQTSTD
jgi:hypothetical protein